MGVPNNDGCLDEDEVDVAQLYCVLVLKKLKIDEDSSDEETPRALGKSQKDISQQDIVNLTHYDVFCINMIQTTLTSPSSSVGRAPGS